MAGQMRDALLTAKQKGTKRKKADADDDDSDADSNDDSDENAQPKKGTATGTTIKKRPAAAATTKTKKKRGEQIDLTEEMLKKVPTICKKPKMVYKKYRIYTDMRAGNWRLLKKGQRVDTKFRFCPDDPKQMKESWKRLVKRMR
eukprot:12412893-Karenia_brevis.AAC.1